MTIVLLGIDLAKNVFTLHGIECQSRSARILSLCAHA